MPADSFSTDADIIHRAYEDRIRDLFKIFAEAVQTGEPEREAVVRFQRALNTARRVREAAMEAAKPPA
ncbi:MAG TPA: hypothetical protein VMB84_09865 [Stellaceae bacterium]|nr:hypothetical protein [Stellaceae bacterium]